MKLLTVAEVARRLGITPDRVRSLEREHKLPALRTETGRRIFLEEDVRRFIERKRQKGRRA
jgi:excisionase family DNA binding protein